MYISKQTLGIGVEREDFTTFKLNSSLNHVLLLLRKRKDNKDMHRRGGGKEEGGSNERGSQK